MVNIQTPEEILQKNIPYYDVIPLSDEAHIIKSMKEYALQFFNQLEKFNVQVSDSETEFEKKVVRHTNILFSRRINKIKELIK